MILSKVWRSAVRLFYIRFNPLRLDEDDYVALALSSVLSERRRLGRRLYRFLQSKPQDVPITVHAVRLFDNTGSELRLNSERRNLARELLQEWGSARGLRLDQFFVESANYGYSAGYGAIFTGEMVPPRQDTRLSGMGFRGYLAQIMLLGREEPFVPGESKA